MTTRVTCRRCRGQEVDESGLPCARCDGYGIESVFPPETPDPEQVWMHAKMTQVHSARDTYERTHSEDCWRWHIDCAVKRVERAERAADSLRESNRTEYEAGVVAGKALAQMPGGGA